MKIANITPAHKKDKPTNKENYRPKVFERLLYDQLSEYLEKFLNTLLCGFKKAHFTQPALFKLLQKWQEELYITLVLSKGYDFLPYDIRLSKFEPYGMINWFTFNT